MRWMRPALLQPRGIPAVDVDQRAQPLQVQASDAASVPKAAQLADAPGLQHFAIATLEAPTLRCGAVAACIQADLQPISSGLLANSSLPSVRCRSTEKRMHPRSTQLANVGSGAQQVASAASTEVVVTALA